MPTSPAALPVRQPSRHALQLVPADRERGGAGRLARAATLHHVIRPLAHQDAGAAASWALQAAVRAYVARCKAKGLPPERVLLRLTEAARCRRLTSRRAGSAPGVRGEVFRAFLLAYYGDDRARPAAPGWAAGGESGGAVRARHGPGARQRPRTARAWHAVSPPRAP